MEAPQETRSGAAVVVPARLQSRRFPRKVLARETGKFLIQHVYEAVSGTPGVSRIIIATDSQEVEEAARSFGADVCMTSTDHISGTDRVAEVARNLKEEIIVNVQGDEPLISRDDLAGLVKALALTDTGTTHMATLARPRCDLEGYRDPNIVKVVLGEGGQGLYFSRSPIPYSFLEEGKAAEAPLWFQHVGIYGYRRDFLETFTQLAPGKLEKQERLEQLRALECGYSIQVVLTTHEYTGIDTQDEYRAFVAWYRRELSSPATAGG